MPNWVRNRIIISGENAAEIIAQHTVVNEEGKTDFDFNTIVKMPDELLIERSVRSTDALKLYIAKINPTIRNIGEKTDKVEYVSFSKKLLDIFGQRAMEDIPLYLLRYSEVEGLKKAYRKNLEEVLELGRRIFVNKQKYGYSDWYDWSCENWGTKWNAGNTEIEGNTVYFNTDWKPPIPAIVKLARLHPECEIELSYAEKQPGILCGYYVFRNNEVITGRRYEDESKEAFDLHFVLWGGKDKFTYLPSEKTYIRKSAEEME